MVRASPYVIQNIFRVLEKRDFSEMKELLEKLSMRYSEDRELTKIRERYVEYLETGDLNRINDIKMSLKRLKSIRISGISESSGLWFRDRRPNTMQVIRVL